MERIILASGSPRRREILEQVGIPFEVIVSEVEEKITSNNPVVVVQELAMQKAEAVRKEVRGSGFIIGADTVVVYKNGILGKPKDNLEACEMLTELQNQEHQVYTGVAIIVKSQKEIKHLTFSVETKVRIQPMTKGQIEDYVATGEPLDKAGAYGIQGKFALYIKEIIGDYYNVVGFPISSVYEKLIELGFKKK